MENVEFDENQGLPNRQQSARKTPKLVGLIMKTGFVKDEEQANYILLGFAIFALVLSVFIFNSNSNSTVKPLYEESRMGANGLPVAK